MRVLARVQNPVLLLPSFKLLRTLDADSLRALRLVLLEMRREARAQADVSWRRHKGPMAAYWRAVSVYAGHIARALR